MEAAHLHVSRFRRKLYWLVLPGSLVAWAYLRFGLGWPAPTDGLVLMALFAEAALVLSHHPAR
jgi:hypothetical protein